jgi:hypothetical protein
LQQDMHQRVDIDQTRTELAALMGAT